MNLFKIILGKPYHTTYNDINMMVQKGKILLINCPSYRNPKINIKDIPSHDLIEVREWLKQQPPHQGTMENN